MVLIDLFLLHAEMMTEAIIYVLPMSFDDISLHVFLNLLTQHDISYMF